MESRALALPASPSKDWGAAVSEWRRRIGAVKLPPRRRRYGPGPLAVAQPFAQPLPACLPEPPSLEAIAALPTRTRLLVGALLAGTGPDHADARAGQIHLGMLSDACPRHVRRMLPALVAANVVLAIEHGEYVRSGRRILGRVESDHYLLHPRLVAAYWQTVYALAYTASQSPPAASAKKQMSANSLRHPSGAGLSPKHHSTVVPSSRACSGVLPTTVAPESDEQRVYRLLTEPTFGMRSWMARRFVRERGAAEMLRLHRWVLAQPNIDTIEHCGRFLFAALRDGWAGMDVTAQPSRRPQASAAFDRRAWAIACQRERAWEAQKRDGAMAAQAFAAALGSHPRPRTAREIAASLHVVTIARARTAPVFARGKGYTIVNAVLAAAFYPASAALRCA